MTISSVTLNGFQLTSFTGVNSFTLTVIDSCTAAVVTASTVPNFMLSVFTPVSVYGAFSTFTYVTSNGFANCGSFTYTKSIALGTSTNSLSTFSLD